MEHRSAERNCTVFRYNYVQHTENLLHVSALFSHFREEFYKEKYSNSKLYSYHTQCNS